MVSLHRAYTGCTWLTRVLRLSFDSAGAGISEKCLSTGRFGLDEAVARRSFEDVTLLLNATRSCIIYDFHALNMN